MTDNTKHNIPQLRFPEFTGEWKEKMVGEVSVNEDFKRQPVSKMERVAGQYPYYGANGVQDYVDGFIFEGERLLVGEDGSVLTKDNTPVLSWAEGKFWVNNHAHVLAQKGEFPLKYLYYSLSTQKISGLVTGIPPKLNQENLNNIKISCPPSPSEQQKIAECLSALDDMINTEEQKTEALREYKRGLMQQLFPANGASTPQLRFPGFTGEWKEKKLGEVCDRITEKVGNVLLEPISVSANVGIISQKQRFGKDISGEQYKNYIHIKKGDYCYNKGNSKYFPQGCIYELHTYEEAAAPNAFISFRFKDSVVPHFFNGYFDQNAHGKQLVQYITSGARSDGLLNLNVEDFFKIKFLLPPTLAEQQKMADCLSSLDEMITAQASKTETLREYKRGLMQQLFPQHSK